MKKNETAGAPRAALPVPRSFNRTRRVAPADSRRLLDWNQARHFTLAGKFLLIIISDIFITRNH
ncbi:hypothetical protein [Paraburkholderia tagetis]|uniref:Uncharacterized protein n=1 Tax=Paraburkholderia tagetis TaxID=2913261 RepID=A0A9X1ULV0_9BURK|nr:hypothetical protein [Paraburkholderia tagetis]MCG5077557.1 hypothetical protein [Paraburkholderia tagetis]